MCTPERLRENCSCPHLMLHNLRIAARVTGVLAAVAVVWLAFTTGYAWVQAAAGSRPSAVPQKPHEDVQQDQVHQHEPCPGEEPQHRVPGWPLVPRCRTGFLPVASADVLNDRVEIVG